MIHISTASIHIRSLLQFKPHLAQLPVYLPGRPIEEVAREHGIDPSSVIKLASNENPLGPSPKAVAAMRAALDHVHLYPDGGAFAIKRRLAEWLGVETENLVLGNGSNELIEWVGHLALGPGDEVVVSQYCFAVYPIVTAMFEAKLVTVPARQFGHDIPAMLAAVTPRTKIMFVANPNNPTGTLASREHIALLLNKLPPEVLLVMDEAYIDFLEDPIDCLPLVRNGSIPNLFLMRTFSKIYGLAGIRIGYGIGSTSLVSMLEKVRQPFNVNSIAQAGTLAAIDDREHLERTRANNRDGLAYFHRAFAKLRKPFIRSSANFVMVDVGDGTRVAQELQRLGVIVRPMAGYGLPSWIRVSVGTPSENQRFIADLQRVIPAI